jgi:8-oxo-dGTP diphosphatase
MASLDTAHAPIRTERLLLRPLRANDAEPLFALFADWEVIRQLNMPPWPYAIRSAEQGLISAIGWAGPIGDAAT